MKKIFNKNNYPIIIALVVGLLCLILGSFFDHKISFEIADPNNTFGKIFETILLLPSFFGLASAGMMVFVALKDDKRSWVKAIAWICLIICYGASTYFSGKEIKSGGEPYGFRFTPWLAFLITALTMAAVEVAMFFLLNKLEKEKLIRTAILIVATYLITFGFIEFTKYLACRPRYRFLIDSSLNINGEVFKNWWQFNPFKFSNNAHKSFPSGHSAFTVQVLLFPIIYQNFKKHNNVARYILTGCCLAFLFTMMFARIIAGAHFLSDVGMGCMVSCIIIFIVEFFVYDPKYSLPNPKEVKTEE